MYRPKRLDLDKPLIHRNLPGVGMDPTSGGRASSQQSGAATKPTPVVNQSQRLSSETSLSSSFRHPSSSADMKRIPRFLRRPSVQGRTGLPKSTLYKLMSEGKFPQPYSLGARSVAWLEQDVEEWMLQILGRSAPSDQTLLSREKTAKERRTRISETTPRLEVARPKSTIKSPPILDEPVPTRHSSRSGGQ